MLVLGTLQAQYDTTHYIPYLTDFPGQTKTANLEHDGGAYIMFSTFETSNVNVKVYRASSGGWALVKEIKNLKKGTPHLWQLNKSKTDYFFRYSQYFKYNTPS